MLPPDQQILIGCLLSAIPICYLTTYLKKPNQIILLSIAVSMTMQALVFGVWSLLLWTQQVAIYFMCKWLPSHNIGKTVLIETFSVLTLVQLWRMYTNYGEENVDITAIFMMQVFQYVSFAYNYQDGQSSTHITKYSIAELPSFLHYLGYVQFIPSCLVGPVFEFRDFHDFVHRSGVFQNISGGCSTPAMKK